MWIVPGDEQYESARPTWDARFDDARPAAIARCGSTAEVAAALDPYGLALPAGTCPEVRIAGLTPGGDFGPLGRGPGVLADRLRGAEDVPADDRTVCCDEDRQIKARYDPDDLLR